jgi:hypothetical protein
VLLLSVWLIVAIAISANGLLTQLRPPAPQALIVVLTAVCLALARLVPTLRAWLDRVDIRAIIALHNTRLVAGIAFLVLPEHGEGWRSFALPAGYGDIVVGLLAIAVIIWVPAKASASAIWFCRAWNLFGFADILFVVGNAARLGLVRSRFPGTSASNCR